VKLELAVTIEDVRELTQLQLQVHVSAELVADPMLDQRLVAELKHVLQLDNLTQVLEHTVRLLFMMYVLLERPLAEDAMYQAAVVLAHTQEAQQDLPVHTLQVTLALVVARLAEVHVVEPAL
jgi:hypothetical protein